MRYRTLLTTTILIASFVFASGQEGATGRIKGRIIDLFGNPIAGAQVLITTNGTIERRLVTDQNGTYEADGLPAANYSISTSLRGFHTANRSAYLGPGEQIVIELGLQPGRLGPVERVTVVTGSVRQSDGKRVEGATITMMSAFNQEIREQTDATSAGRFELKIAEPGQYVIYVSKPGFGVDVKAITVATKLSREPLVVDFELISLPR